MQENKQSKEIPMYIIVGLFVIFILAFYFTQGSKIPSADKNQSPSGASLQKFSETLQASNELGIVMNVSSAAADQARYLYACGAGLAGSWGKLGKNISNLHIYVVSDSECTYSNPILQNNTITKTPKECVDENANRTYFDIKYGASYSIFTDHVAYLFVDETFEQECKFEVSQSTGAETGTVSDNQTIIQAVNQTSQVGENMSKNATTTGTGSSTKVLLETNMGNITLELRSDMPITAGNFAKLVGQGFYDGVIFHRVMSGFMIQGGDPTGTGAGGPSYTIKDEFTANNKNDRGTIAMANAGPNTGGSQFFINLVNNNFLDSKHPVFGKVIEGMDVVDKIGKVQTDSDDRPLQNVTIISAKII